MLQCGSDGLIDGDEMETETDESKKIQSPDSAATAPLTSKQLRNFF
jgi:hypothetical protein